MRWMALILAALNIFLYGWNLVAPAEPPNELYAVHHNKNNANTNRLILLSETTKRSSQLEETRHVPLQTGSSEVTESPPIASASITPSASNTPSVKFSNSSPGPVCFNIQGIESESAREKFTIEISQKKVQVLARGTSPGERIRYWVMIPAFENAESAAPMLQKIKKMGISDYYFVRNGENQNAISLGVYSTPQSAERRLEQMKFKGLDAVLREVPYPVTRYSAVIKFKDAPSAAWSSEIPYGATFEELSCP